MPIDPLAPPPSSRPATARIAELVHHGARTQLEREGGAVVVYVDHDDPSEELSLGLWPVPGHAAHPADPLVGFLAPPAWDAIGLATTGKVRHLDDRGTPPARATTTVLIDRVGPGASVIEVRGSDPLVLEEAPVGWVADVLARALGRPTPPSMGSPAIMVELSWLDRLASGVLDRPSRVRSWRWMANCHPLRGTGLVPTPDELAARTAAKAAQQSWGDLLAACEGVELPASASGPPGGVPTTAAAWFDDGTLSRWLARAMVPPEQVLPDLLEVLPSHLGASLLDTLVEIEVDLSPAA